MSVPALAATPGSGRTVVVDTADNASTPGDGKTSLLEALLDLRDLDRIHFNIPGDGPHVLATPMGGYPPITRSDVLMDGYSQPGATPNNNPILGGNNARLKIVLDSTSDASATNPQNPDLPLRTSTRLPYDGYGNTENAILPILGATGVVIRGLSFQARFTAGNSEDPSIYSVALIRGAQNCRIQGNWFGLAPDGVTVKGSTDAVAAYQFRVEGVPLYSDNLVIGTDSDGTEDLAEFNIFAGHHITLGLELPGLRVAGNYFNVLPDGKTFLNVNEIHEQLLAVGRSPADSSVENIENGRDTTGTVIGVSGDGVNDANERNIFNLAVYSALNQFYTSAQEVRISGNYFGVGVDGVAKAPPVSLDYPQPSFLLFPDTGSILIGSNFDEVSDLLEGNLIVGVPGTELVAAGPAVPIIARANNMSGNQFTGFPFENGSEQRFYETYYATVVQTPASPAPVLVTYEEGILRGKVALPVVENYPFVDVDIYLADPLAPSGVTLPGTYVGTLSEGDSEEDSNDASGEFAFDLSPFNVPPGRQLLAVASYQKQEDTTNAGDAIVSPVSNALSTGDSGPLGPVVITVDGNNLRLTWTGGTAPYQVQSRGVLTSGSWLNEGAPVTEATAVISIPETVVSFYQIVSQ